MKSGPQKSAKSGMTTIEVFISLLILSIFLFAGFQLYDIVLISNLETQARASASNIAYGHLRALSDSLDMSSCSGSIITKALTPQANENLNGLEITAKLTAPYSCSYRMMRVEVTVKYNLRGSDREETQVVYVQK